MSMAIGTQEAAIPTLPSASPDRFRRHRGPVTCVAAVPGQRLILTSAYDSAVGCFDRETGEATIFGYHKHLVNRIIVNDAGTKAASCSSDYTVCIWDLQMKQLERVLRGHSDDAEDFVFVSDRVGVSASRDHRIIVWDLTTGAITRIIDDHEKDVLSLAYVDGKIISSGDDKTLRVFDLETGRPLNLWGPFELETDTCAIDPRTGRVILGCDDGVVRIFNLSDGSLVREIAGHTLGVKKVAVSPVSGDILSSAYDQKLLVWDAQTFEQKLSLERTPVMWERSLNWSSDGQTVLAGTFDGTVIGWDAVTGKFLFELGNNDVDKGNACFNDVSASSAGEIALVSDDGYVRLASVTPAGTRLLTKAEPSSGRVLMNGVAFSSAHNLVVAGAHNHRIYLFDKHGDKLTGEREVWLGEGPINTIAIAEIPGYQGDSFVGCYSSAIIRVGADSTVKSKIQVHDGAVKALCLHPTLPIGVSSGADGVLVSWGFDGELRQQYLGHTAIINDVDLDPTGTYIASVSRDFSLKIYQRDGGTLLRSIRLGRRSLKSVCFFDDNTVLVGDYWGTLMKVELDTERVTRATISINGVSALAASGDYVVAASYDGGVYLVSPRDMSIVASLRSMRQRVHDRHVQ
jgi:WD40 repeat protein